MAELFSPGKIIFILIVAFFIFGPKKLPELGKAAGRTLVEFKNAAANIMDHHEPEKPSADLLKHPTEAEKKEPVKSEINH